MKAWLLVASLTVVILVGCSTDPKSSRGFTLPDGNVEGGEAAFVELKCNACHSVRGTQISQPDESPELTVALGGEVSRVKTYGELVTSIINPSHRLAKGYAAAEVGTEGESKMQNYNDVLTVQELIDLVAFLQSHYELMEYEPTDYPLYY